MNDITPVQTDVFTKLTANPATYPVYDGVPQSVARPYIVIGEVTAEPDEEYSLTTTDASINLHVWSGSTIKVPVVGGTSKSQCYTMLQFIRARLDGVAVSGTWAFTEEFNEVMEDPASTQAARIYHGIARYRARIG